MVSDQAIDAIAAYCTTGRPSNLSPATIHGATQRVVDALGCALAAIGEPTPAITERVAPKPSVAGVLPAGRVLGSGIGTTLEAAAFANTALIRYLDFNDQFPGGHPSDVVGPLFTLADALGTSGREFIEALTTAYQVFAALSEQIARKLRRAGWDQGLLVGLATTAGAVALLDLDTPTAREALALTAVTSTALRATRAGSLSLWKGAATAHAARNALFVTSLAAAGMTGPGSPIEGRHGLQEVITGPFMLHSLEPTEGDYAVTRSRLKFWPVEYNLQAAVWAGLHLATLVRPEAVESIEIATYWNAWHECASEPEKWDPRTRETADHSLPYVLAHALTHQAFGVEAFEPTAYTDPALRPLMQRIRVFVDPDLDSLHPETVTLRLRVRTVDGEEIESSFANPKGHTANPMTDQDVTDKFLAGADRLLGRERAAAAAASLWELQWSTVPTQFSLLCPTPS